MTFSYLAAFLLIMSLLIAESPEGFSQQRSSPSPPPLAAASPLVDSEFLQALVRDAVAATATRFAESQVRAEELAVTLLVLEDSGGAASKASHRGDVQIYPASVIKLFYLVAAHQWMEDGRLEDTDELRRAMRDMIVHSYNEATHYVIDLLTETTSGPELSAEALAAWYDKRNAVNRYFSSLGYKKVNANRKPWCEGPYGRETQSIARHAPNHRNWLTTDESARLVGEIVTGRAVNARRSGEMMELMRREHMGKASNRDQGNAYTGAALSDHARLWSKAGWTSQVRHDAAYVELPDGTRFVLVIFTEGHAYLTEVIPFLAGRLIEGLEERRKESEGRRIGQER